MLGRSASTISRELGRNTLAELPYASHSAQVSSQGRRQAARPTRKLDMQGVGWGVVLTLLDWRWSPQQIAGTLKRVFPNEPERHVSHETIYNAIYAQPRGERARHNRPEAGVRRGARRRVLSTTWSRSPPSTTAGALSITTNASVDVHQGTPAAAHLS